MFCLVFLTSLLLASCNGASYDATGSVGTPILKTIQPKITEPAQKPELISPSNTLVSDAAITINGTDASDEIRVTSTSIPSPTPDTSATAHALRPNTALTSDLLFLAADRLMRWDPRTAYGVTLAENVKRYSADRTGKKIALLRQKQIAANGSELFDLDLLRLETKQIEQLSAEIPSVEQISLSPDGSWVVFYPSSKDGSISAFNINNPENKMVLGRCIRMLSTDCLDLAWSPNSQDLVWIDSRGIWMSNISKQSAVKLNVGQVQITDPQGETAQVEVGFQKPQWSPAGRYVLVEVSPNESQVSWNAVLDTSTHRISQVMDTYADTLTTTSLTWLFDGTILTARGSNLTDNQQAALHHYQVIPTTADLLIQLQDIQLTPTDLFNPIKLEDLVIETTDRLVVNFLQASNSNRVLFGAKLIEKSDITTFFELDVSTMKLHPIIQINEEIQQVFLAPERSGMVIVTNQTGVFYADLVTNEVTNLSSSIDADMHAFLWLPAEPRP